MYRLKKNILLFILILLNSFIHSKTYYVSQSTGSDNFTGDFKHPFQTLRIGLEKLNEYDTLLIREGLYYLSTKTQLKSNVYISAFENEKVEIHGTEIKKTWSLVANNLWKSTQTDSVIQLFINGKPYFQAAYPTISEDLLALKRGAFSIAYSNKKIFLQDLNNFNDIENVNAIGIYGKKLVSFSGNIKNKIENSFEIENQDFFWNENFKKEYLDTGNAFLYGNKVFLNDENEWFWSNNELFIVSSTNPNDLNIEVRSSNYLFEAIEKNNISLTNLNFIGFNMNIENCSSINIKNCTFSFVTPFFKFTDSYRYTKDNFKQWDGKGLTLWGKNLFFIDNLIRHSWGDGITVNGENIILENNEIYDCDWTARDCAPIYIIGNNHTIKNNTIYNSARSALVHNIQNSRIINNHIYNSGLICEDLGLTYTYGSDGRNTEIAYNYLHNNNAKQNGAALYIDNGSKNYIVHHNIITNSLVGININKSSENNLIYHNTLYNNTYSMGSWGPEGTFIKNVKTFNNLTNTNKKASWNYDAFYGTSMDSNYVYFENNIFVDPLNHNFQLRKNSYPIDRGIKNEYTTNYEGSSPDIGAIESGVPPWKYGSSLIIPNEKYYPPKAPLHLELLANTFDTTLLRWNYPFQLIDSFYIERKSATETNYSIIARIAKYDTTYNDANQPPGEYRYQIRAINQYGISEPSNSIQIFNPITNNSLYFDAEESDLQEGTNRMGDVLINTDNKDWICFKGVDLANTMYDACMVNMAVPCESAWQEIQVRLDHPMGRMIGKFRPPSTGGWDKYKMYSFPIEEIKGTHDIYFRFKGEYGIGTMDWFTFYDSNGEVKENIPYDSVCPFPSLKNREVKMRVFPNPVYNEINLTLDCQEKSTLDIEVFDTRGIVYYRNTYENLIPGTVEIHLHDDPKINELLPGVYMVNARIRSKKVDSSSMLKFIKTNE
jgi:hypothetical protein